MADASESMQKRRGTTAGQPRSYSAWEWGKGYAAWLLVLPLYLGLWVFATVFKRLPNWLTAKLLREHDRETMNRPCDVRIPGDLSIHAYMFRWWRIKRNAFFNIYFHRVQRSDDDRALHDHPWWSFSIVLDGGYFEHTIAEGGVHSRRWYGPGSVRFRRSGAFAHRLELAFGVTDEGGEITSYELPARTIFITGPVLRRWGFHHPKQWVDAFEWDDFLARQGAVNTMPMGNYADQLKRTES